ncbi:MAG: MscL family protein [Vigna little leaf phytoplasma]|nr:MscL family protein [Vigna little leaf phytoplasma]
MISKLKQQLNDFKSFIFKGGDLIKITVAFIMGQLFSKVTTSLATDVLMPPINWLFIKQNFDDLKLNLNNEGISINYGHFLQTLFEFLFVSFFLYILLNVFLKKIYKISDPSQPKNDPQLISIQNIEILSKEQIAILKQISESLAQNSISK